MMTLNIAKQIKITSKEMKEKPGLHLGMVKLFPALMHHYISYLMHHFNNLLFQGSPGWLNGKESTC